MRVPIPAAGTIAQMAWAEVSVALKNASLLGLEWLRILNAPTRHENQTPLVLNADVGLDAAAGVVHADALHRRDLARQITARRFQQ